MKHLYYKPVYSKNLSYYKEKSICLFFNNILIWLRKHSTSSKRKGEKMSQNNDSKKYYPTALALYITYIVLGIAATMLYL